MLPIGLAVWCSENLPGSVSDVDIFHRICISHKVRLAKKDDDNGIMDVGIGSQEYPDHWAAFCDKGYQEGMECTRAAHPKKKPHNRFLSTEEEKSKNLIVPDRIVVENYYGPMFSLRDIMSTKYRLGERI